MNRQGYQMDVSSQDLQPMARGFLPPGDIRLVVPGGVPESSGWQFLLENSGAILKRIEPLCLGFSSF